MPSPLINSYHHYPCHKTDFFEKSETMTVLLVFGHFVIKISGNQVLSSLLSVGLVKRLFLTKGKSEFDNLSISLFRQATKNLQFLHTYHQSTFQYLAYCFTSNLTFIPGNTSSPFHLIQPQTMIEPLHPCLQV